MAIKEIDIAKILNAISDSNRVKIVLLLSDGGKCANSLLQKMPFSQPTLSHHISILCDANVLNAKRNGKEIIYTINKDVADKIANFASILQSANTETQTKITTAKSKPVVKKSQPKPASIITKEQPKVEQPVIEEVKIEQPKTISYQNDDFDFLD